MVCHYAPKLLLYAIMNNKRAKNKNTIYLNYI